MGFRKARSVPIPRHEAHNENAAPVAGRRAHSWTCTATTGCCVPRCLERDLLHVHVVSDHGPEHATGNTADHRTLELVSARYGADRRTGYAADDGITLGVLYDPRTRPGRPNRAASRRPRGRRRAIDPLRNRLRRLRVVVASGLGLDVRLLAIPTVPHLDGRDELLGLAGHR